MVELCSEITKLTRPQFNAISQFVKQQCGFNLHDGKIALVEARLSKRLRALGLSGFDQYVRRIRDDDGAETAAMLDALSTNVTYFFREPQHFDFLRDSVIPRIFKEHRKDRRIRIWSAGCSSGEEPYSIAMLLRTAISDLDQWDVRILATDLSRQMLERARQGLYGSRQLRQMPKGLIRPNFTTHKKGRCVYCQIKDPPKGMVNFARLNLMDPWPMQGPFDIIFCRNVMIYFDNPTQQRLVDRVWEILAPGGNLFIGHSESLAGIQHAFHYVKPAVYQKRSTTK